MRAAGRYRVYEALACAAVAAASTGACNVFESLETCEHDTDCALGERCNPDGAFCEPDDGPIVIGASMALTGSAAPLNGGFKSAIKVAQHVINDAGGVLGRPVKFKIVDDESDPELSRDVIERLIVDDRVVAIIGPGSSTQALATEDVTYKHHVIQISPTAGSPLLSTAQPESDRYFFRTISTMRGGSAAAVALFARSTDVGKKPCARMAIVHTDDATGIAYRDAVAELFGNLGGCVVATIPVPAALQFDYDAAIAGLVAAQPECAHLAAWPDIGAALVRGLGEVARMDPDPWQNFMWIGNTTTHSEAFLEACRADPLMPTPSLADGVHGGDVDSTPPTPAYKEFRVLYNDTLGQDLELDAPAFAANAYDAAILVALALEHAGTVADRERIRDGLWAVSGQGPDHAAFGPTQFAEAKAAIRRHDPIHYVGASSNLVFDATGTVSNPTLIWHVENGAFTTVGRYTEEQVRAVGDMVPETPACP